MSHTNEKRKRLRTNVYIQKEAGSMIRRKQECKDVSDFC